MGRSLATAACLVVALPGQEPPDDLATPYEAAGFLCRTGTYDRVRLPTVAPQTLGLLWVGDDWEEGLRFLADPELPDVTRQSLVLVGERPPSDLGPRIREAGGLSWSTHPPPAWLPLLLLDVVLGREPTGGIEVLGALQALRPETRPGSRLVLRTLAEVARGQPGENAPDSAVIERRLEAFLHERLGAQAWCGDVMELQVRVSPYSRVQHPPPWVHWALEDRTPSKLPEDFSQFPEGEPFAFEDGWALWLPLGRPYAPKGTLFALFETHTGAVDARADVANLATDLELGARMVRQAADAAAQVRISEELAGTGDPERIRDRVLDRILQQLNADGLKLGLVRPGSSGLELVPLVRRLGLTHSGSPLTVEPLRGLADRVLDQADWLLVESLSPPDQVGWQPEHALCGKSGAIETLARSPESTILAPQPEERSLLWVPLTSQNELSGVLGVWRNSGAPFDRDLDVQSLLHFAPYVAAASERMLQQDKKREEFAAIRRLSQQLEGMRELPAAERAVVAAVGELAEAAGALGLWLDGTGRLHVGGVWAARPELEGFLRKAVADIRLDAGSEVERWEGRVRLALEPQLAGRYCFRTLLAVEDEGASSPHALVLLDPDDRPTPYHPFARQIPNLAAATLLPYARALLSQHVYSTASRVGERISGLEAEEGEIRVERLLKEAAEQLKLATGADAVLIYLGDNVRMGLQRSAPDLGNSLQDLRIDKATLARRSLDQRRSIRLADVSDPSDENRNFLDQHTLNRMTEAFHLVRPRSWLCVPVAYGKRPVGVIKLLTADHGRFLGPQDQEVVEAVARRMAWELQKVSTRIMLEELDQIARRLADTGGAELGTALLTELGPWVDRHIRPGCNLVILARSNPGRPLIEAHNDAPPDWVSRLDGLSRYLGNRGHEWQRGVNLKTGDEEPSPFPSAGIAAPIFLPQLSELEGHFIILHAKAFSPEQANVAMHAARALSVILNAERIRQTVFLGAALFRHALLGAVQGLSDAALHLAEFPDLPQSERDLDIFQIHWESENIRFWSSTQRLMRFDQPGKLEVRPRKNALKKVFDTCAHRYRKMFESRGIRFVEEWKVTGSLEFDFDTETLDLALSNLLHNAAKYAFYNREVVLGAQVSGENVQIWVEDVGHPLPEQVRESLYSQGRRYVQDPLRAIPGEGMGLYMVRRVVEAHEGRITHSCERVRISPKESISPTNDKTPYRVRFTLELPHHWKRGRG